MSRKQILFVLAVAANVLALVVLVAVLLPTRAPSQSTSETYRSLYMHRSLRAEVRREAPPPSIIPSAAISPSPTPQTVAAPVQTMRIKRIGVDAQLVALNLTADGAMDVPNSPQLVAWYDFTGKPGLGGNAVFSGHVDWRNYGPAVFWRLKELVPGDGIDVVLTDGTLINYRVTAAWSYPVQELQMSEILAQTSAESLTLITCTGQFAGGEYTDRLVLRAIRTGIVRASTGR